MGSRGAVVGSAVAAIVLAFVGGAHADGDPASDTLVTQDYFLPAQAPSNDATSGLKAAIAAVFAKHYRIKVAVVGAPSDLGAVPELFNKPKQYARFLGSELEQFYVGPLLIVMPAGFGVYDGARSTDAEDRVLASQSVSGPSPDELVRSATAAVKALTAARALKSKDIRSPLVYPRPITAFRGKTARFTYIILEDSERTKDTIKITSGRKRVATIRTKLHPAVYSHPWTTTWRVPRSVKPGHLRFCIVATDAAGNRGVPACEQLTVH